MRTTKVLSVTLPSPMLLEAQQLAKQENRTMSELVREALRQYQRQRQWESITAFGKVSAEAAGVLDEEGVVEAIHAYRQESRRKRKSSGKTAR